MPQPPETPTARLAWETIFQRPTGRVPTHEMNVMEWRFIERLAGAREGDYRRDPEAVYVAYQRAMGVCMLGQFIPDNALSMGSAGYEADTPRTATTGAARIVLDGIAIDSPEAVCEHLERVAWPRRRAQAAAFDEAERAAQIVARERDLQRRCGPEILKTGYGFVPFPSFAYGAYGYENYFMAYALYPEVLERDFASQADLCLLHNRAAARAFAEGDLPPFYRLDHDMADGRGLLVDVRSLERLWLPHFARCLEPVLRAGVRLVWHCDGNLMDLVPRLIDVGVRGFQGFQYECGMDYPAICRMKAADGGDLLIMAGVSVTRTLPRGRPQDVRRELAWLVDNGPPTGLFLGASSSITPGVPWENLQALVEGLRHYRQHR